MRRNVIVCWVMLSGLLISLVSCTPNLEREDIPIIPGIRLNHYPYGPEESPTIRAEAEAQVHQQNEAAFAEWELTDLLIDVPLDYDSITQGPMLDSLTLQALDRALAHYPEQAGQLHLALTSDNPGELFRARTRPLDLAWCHQLDSCMQLVEELSEAAGFTVKRMIIGNNWEPFEAYLDGRARVYDLHHARSSVRLAYGIDITRLDSIESLAEMDELALGYPPQPTLAPKPFCRKWNKKASEKAQMAGLPIFIFQGNILEVQSRYAFENRLRFWSDEVEVEGLTLNSIYTASSLSEGESYFGLTDEAGFLAALEKYLGQ